MVLVSFSLETQRGPAYKLIQLGEKAQTGRLAGQHRIQAGKDLQLFWKSRVPISQKPIHLIADAWCTTVFHDSPYGSFKNDDKFAYADGFVNSEELRKWFNVTHGKKGLNDKTLFDIICWKLYYPVYKCPICGYTSTVTNIHRECNRMMYPTGKEQVDINTNIIERTLIPKFKNFSVAKTHGAITLANDLAEKREVPDWSREVLINIFGLGESKKCC